MHDASIRRCGADECYWPGDRLLDPGFAREPVVIGTTERATGIGVKHDAAQKCLPIGLNPGRDCASCFRAFDHNHPHASLP